MKLGGGGFLAMLARVKFLRLEWSTAGSCRAVQTGVRAGVSEGLMLGEANRVA